MVNMIRDQGDEAEEKVITKLLQFALEDVEDDYQEIMYI